MAPKRTFELTVGDSDQSPKKSRHSLSNDDHEPPQKRRMISMPHTPLPNRFSRVHTIPRTPFTGTPYPTRPSDSPSNPFGRKRTQVLAHSLPPPTSFSQHLPLRFQFVRPGVSPRLGGIYRVVQVPLSYTFAQLRCLIAFLFGAGFGDEREDRHLFEVKKKLSLYSQMYKPGQIKSGFTAVKLSTARDPCRYRPEVDEDALSTVDCQSSPQQSEGDTGDFSEDADEGEGWTWEPEEDYTLGHAWSRGGDLSRGVIYHHTPAIAVHVTVNTSPIPRRKGISNTPYVFQARGRVRLLPPSPMPLPRPVFSVPAHKLTSPEHPDSANRRPSRSSSLDPDQGEDSDVEFGDGSCGLFQDNAEKDEESSDEEEDGEEEDPNAMLSPKKFNKPKAFAAYLRFVHQRRQRWEFSKSDDSDSEGEALPAQDLGSTPGLIHCSSSPISSSPVALPAFLKSSPTSRSLNKIASYDVYKASVLTLTSLSKPGMTPAPAHAPWQLLRLERARRRMERLKNQNWMHTGDDEEEEEVDELRDNKAEEEPLYVPPVLKPGEVWDPFGDELEV